MWTLRYLILASRQRANAMLGSRTRMTFDPLHGCPVYVCRDKAEWDQYGLKQVAQLESELRQDIEAYHTETRERRRITQETVEVRPVVPAAEMKPMQAFKAFLSQGEPVADLPPVGPASQEQILPEAEPEMEAAPVPMGTALVSSGVEARAEAEPGAGPTSLGEVAVVDGGLPEPEPEERTERTERTEGTPDEKPEVGVVKVKAKTKPAGKAGGKK